jgi:hypothetical protein
VATTDEYRWQNLREGAPVEPPVTERCAYYSFSLSAPLEQGRVAFEAHVCNRPVGTESGSR